MLLLVSASFPGGRNHRVAGLWDGSCQELARAPLAKTSAWGWALVMCWVLFPPFAAGVQMFGDSCGYALSLIMEKPCSFTLLEAVGFVFGASGIDCHFTPDSLRSSQAFLEQYNLTWTQCSLCSLFAIHPAEQDCITSTSTNLLIGGVGLLTLLSVALSSHQGCHLPAPLLLQPSAPASSFPRFSASGRWCLLLL